MEKYPKIIYKSVLQNDIIIKNLGLRILFWQWHIWGCKDITLCIMFVELLMIFTYISPEFLGKRFRCYPW